MAAKTCPQCAKVFSRPGVMRAHLKAVHLGEKPFQCPQCPKAFGYKQALDEHARIAHQDVRPHACTECDRRFHKAADLKKHQAIHARKGFVYRSSREERVARLLEEEGLAFEREVRVDFEGGGLARLDFLLRMDWGLCALEVDEGAHCLREQAEEAERMLKVRARHPKLRFVRYNPDCFGVGGQLAEVPQSERHTRLLRAVCEPPRQDFEVVYLCYDQAQPDSPLPQVCEDPGFPEELKPYVRTDTGSGEAPPP